MKAMEIDSSKWTDEMRRNAVRKLEELGYVRDSELDKYIPARIGVKSIRTEDEYYCLYDNVRSYFPSYTYEQLMAMTKEDVK